MPATRRWRCKLGSSSAEAGNDEIVSFDSEELILVDQADGEIGHLTKSACHDGDGVLHRAFSLFIFNADGELLLQQRSAQKRLWPLYWSNSCCSHPRHGEIMSQAVERRLFQELGIRCKPSFLYKFIYHAKFADRGAEHEYCSVYLGTSEDEVRPNVHEIADWRYIAPDELDRELRDKPQSFTPWLKMEWQRIRGEFQHTLENL